MNLILHQLRVELRRNAFLLALYPVLLAAYHAHVRGWINRPELQEGGYGWQSGTIYGPLLLIAVAALPVILILQCVLADSPARRDRFLTTRPLPAKTLWIAKTLFILLSVVLPAALVEFLALRGIGAPGPIVLRGTIEFLAVLLLFALLTAAFASHWKTTPGAIVAGALAFTLALGVLALVALLVDSNNLENRFHEPTPATLGQAVLFIGLGLALAAVVGARHAWKPARRMAAIAPLLLLAAAVAVWSPFRTLPEPTASSDQSIDWTQLDVTFTSPRVNWGTSTGPSGVARLVATYMVVPNASPAPSGCELRWGVREATWHAGEKILKHENSARRPMVGPIGEQPFPLGSGLEALLQEHAPGAEYLVTADSARGLIVDSLSFDPAQELPNDALRLDASVRLEAHRWSLAAKLPLPAEGVARDGSWELAETRQLDHELSAFLATSDHALLSEPSSARFDRHRFLLHVPDRKLLMVGHPNAVRMPASFSAAKQVLHHLEFNFQNTQLLALSDEELSSARLLVLRSTRVDGTLVDLHRDGIRLPSPEIRRSLAGTRQPAGQFARWIWEHRDQSPEADPATVRKHLEELLQHAAHSEGYFAGFESPAVRHLARFVPGHLEVFLDLLDSTHDNGQNLLPDALTLGALPGQREMIVAALSAHPELIAVITARGWTESARAALIELAEQGQPDIRVLQALLSLDDPQLDPVVVSTYRRAPYAAAYELLRAAPRIGEEVEEITSATWSTGPVVFTGQTITDDLALPLLQGNMEALAALFERVRFVEEHSGDNNSLRWRLTEQIQRSVVLPADIENKRHISEVILPWLLRHRPEDFHFDPVLQRFVPVGNPAV